MIGGIPDQELTSQLNAFMRAVPLIWSWQELAQWFASGQKHTENRGSETNWICFTLYVLEDDYQDERRYLHVAVSAWDSSNSRLSGSAYQPFCNSFLRYEDGHMDRGECWWGHLIKQHKVAPALRACAGRSIRWPV